MIEAKILPMAPNIVNRAEPFSLAPGFVPSASLTAVTNSTRIGTTTEPEAAPKNARPTINNTLPLSLTSSSQVLNRISQKD
jgi:hypothetical protein